MSQVTFIPLIKAQSQSIRLPVSAGVPTSDYRSLRKRLGMERRQKIIRREALANIRQAVAMEVIEPEIVQPETPASDAPELPRVEQWKIIIREACENNNVTREEFYSKCRAARIILARQEAAYRLVMELDYSYPAVARRIGYADHTTALHAAKSYAQRHNLIINGRNPTAAKRELRNKGIIAAFAAGFSAKEIAKKEKLEPSTVRAIAKKAGFDLKNGSEARRLVAEEEARIIREKQAESLRKAMEVRQRQVQELRVSVHKLAMHYHTIAAASRASGISRRTISKYANEMNLVFGGNE